MAVEQRNPAEKPNSLCIRDLEFSRFRNYEKLHLDDIGSLTVFIGRNAVGKTNILEGIQLLTSANSFRHPQIVQLVNDECQNGRISLHASDGNRELDVSLALEAGKRRYSINGKTKSAADVRGILPSVMFTPDDLQVVKRSSSVKRTALDDLGMQITRAYYLVRKDYEKTIRYKNRLLKEEASRALLESINETLVTCGAQLFCLRRALFERMVPAVSSAYERLSGGAEVFSAHYKPSWERLASTPGDERLYSRDEARQILSSELSFRMSEEIARSRCLVGPHNDEITFTLSGRDASTFASQGQQRTIVLAWKIAEVQIIRDVMGVQPVLLLDDVLSELDGRRREMLVHFVDEDIQTFITATDLDGFSESLVNRANVVKLPLSGGR